MLKSSKIFLRKVQPTDIDIILKWENNPDNWSVSNTQESFSKSDIEVFVNQPQDISINNQIRLMICKLDGVTIGCVDLFEYDAKLKKAGVGILIDEKYRNLGFAQLALELLFDYCRNELNIVHLFCNIQKNNKVSIRLFEKCGFIFENEVELFGEKVNYYQKLC